MYRLLAVVLILLGVYLVTRVLFPIRERLEPTDNIKAPTVRRGNIMSYSEEEQQRIWRMVPNPDDVLASWMQPGRFNDANIVKREHAQWVSIFYRSRYILSQTPITKEQIREFLAGGPDWIVNSVVPLLEAYFIDQAPPPTPQSVAVSNPSLSPENTASAPTLAAGVSAATPDPAMEVSAAMPAPAVGGSAAMPAPAMGGSVKSGPAPIDVTGRATITINVN